MQLVSEHRNKLKAQNCGDCTEVATALSDLGQYELRNIIRVYSTRHKSRRIVEQLQLTAKARLKDTCI
jgi:hypothetical protein